MIREEYITTNISYRALAAKWGVSFNTLKVHAKNEGWKAARDQYRAEVSAQAMEGAKRARIAVETDKMVMLQQSADNMTGVIYDILADTTRFKSNVIARTEDGQGQDRIDTKLIRDLTAAIKDLTGIVRNVYDLPTRQERSSMEIAAERLKLEREKMDGGEAGPEAGVVILPEVPEDPGGKEARVE